MSHKFTVPVEIGNREIGPGDAIRVQATTGSYTSTTLTAEIAKLRVALRVCGAGRLTTDRSDLAALLRIQEIADAALGGDK